MKDVTQALKKNSYFHLQEELNKLEKAYTISVLPCSKVRGYNFVSKIQLCLPSTLI